MAFHRISVKFFLSDPSAVDLDALIGVFHTWIQQSKVEALLIDVADYRHIFQGPGVVLVGHEIDYAMDMKDGRPGLRVVHKQAISTNGPDWLKSALRTAFIGCQALEREESLKRKLSFRTDEFELCLLDHLRATDIQSTMAEYEEPITSFLGRLFSPSVRLEPNGEDPRSPVSFRINAPDAPGLDVLLDRLAVQE